MRNDTSLGDIFYHKIRLAEVQKKLDKMKTRKTMRRWSSEGKRVVGCKQV